MSSAVCYPGRVLSVIPPMTQLNTPYPSTAYITGFLRSRGVDAVQADLALALVLKLFSREGLSQIRELLLALPPKKQKAKTIRHFLDQFGRYQATIDAVIRFLQGGDATLGHRIVSRSFLPEGGRFASLDAYVDPDDPDGPQTGDSSHLWLYICLGAVSLTALVTLFLTKRRKSEQ